MMKAFSPLALACVFVVLVGLCEHAVGTPPTIPVPRIEDIDCTSSAQCAEFGLTCCRSTGKCFDASWQTCCTTGVVCAAEYEQCCNTTCCNKYNSRCIETERLGVSSAQVCSAQQWLSPQRGFMTIGIPVIFLLGAFVITLLTIYLIQSTSLSRLEIAICFPAYYGAIVGCCLVFSPLWVYGSLTFLFSLMAVGAACSRASFPVAFAVGLQHFLFMIYTNPYSPNSLLTIGQTPGGIVEQMRLMVDGSMLQLPTGDAFNGYCPAYYFGYWERDPLARDFRIHNPLEMYFGYCSKEWLTALHIFMTIEVGAIVVLQALLAARWAGLSTWFRRLYEVEVTAVTHHEGAHTLEVKEMH